MPEARVTAYQHVRAVVQTVADRPSEVKRYEGLRSGLRLLAAARKVGLEQHVIQDAKDLLRDLATV